MQRRGQARRGKSHAATVGGVAHLQRQAQHGAGRIDADLAHHLQGLAVGTEQDVLAVVQRDLIDVDPPRAAAELPACFKQGYLVTSLRQLDGGSATGPAGADHGYLSRFCCHFQKEEKKGGDMRLAAHIGFPCQPQLADGCQ